MDPLHTTSAGDYVVEVVYDMYPENPRNDGSGHEKLSSIYGWHRQFQGDQHNYRSFTEWKESQAVGQCDEANYLEMPLFAYIHGGVTISLGEFSDSWDSGMVGVVFTTRGQVREWGWDPDDPETAPQVLEVFRAEVKELDHYLQSDHFIVWVYDRCQHCGGKEGTGEPYHGYDSDHSPEEAARLVLSEFYGVAAPVAA